MPNILTRRGQVAAGGRDLRQTREGCVRDAVAGCAPLMLLHFLLAPAALVTCTSLPSRRIALARGGATVATLGGGLGGLGGLGKLFGAPEPASAILPPKGKGGPTNEVLKTVNGIRHKRLGGGDIVVSELGLGTQRWGSADFNGPDEALCHKMMDRAILEGGVNLLDTAEQYPIPSDFARSEGSTERIIGSWLKKDAARRSKVVIASKITGGRNINAKSIVADCEGSLKRLGTDYMDLYLLHWPARYSPQSNWGQSLAYNQETELYSTGRASFEEIAGAMSDLVKAGKIRGWGMCNDNAFGLTASCYAARGLGGTPPVVMQNDFSIINRRIEENGLTEASSPVHENVGFMAYNLLAGGVLTGKYLERAAAVDEPDQAAAKKGFEAPRGRMDERGWGYTLYRYRSGPADEATRAYAKLAKESGLSLTELSLRWARERSGVTTSLLGHTSMAQLEESLKHFANAKPLPSDLAWEIDRVHMRNRLPIFSSTRVGKDWDGEGQIGEPIP